MRGSRAMKRGKSNRMTPRTTLQWEVICCWVGLKPTTPSTLMSQHNYTVPTEERHLSRQGSNKSTTYNAKTNLRNLCDTKELNWDVVLIKGISL